LHQGRKTGAVNLLQILRERGLPIGQFHKERGTAALSVGVSGGTQSKRKRGTGKGEIRGTKKTGSGQKRGVTLLDWFAGATRTGKGVVTEGGGRGSVLRTPPWEGVWLSKGAINLTRGEGGARQEKAAGKQSQ